MQCPVFVVVFLVPNFSLLILKIDFKLQTEYKLDVDLHVKDT